MSFVILICMNILYVNNFFSPYGGTESIMYDQASIMKKNGHNVFFFSTDKKPLIEENYKFANFFPKHINYKALNKYEYLKYFFRPFYNYDAREKISLYIDAIRPDIAHFHNICYHLTPSVIEPFSKKKIPVVMTLNDPRLMCPGGTLMYKNETYCESLHCFNGNFTHCLLNKCRGSSAKASLFATFENFFNKINKFYDFVDTFICPSQAMKNLAVKSGINPAKLVVLNNFIKDSFLKVQPTYENKGYFLYVGRLAREKKVDLLINAVSSLSDVKLHIVGEGPEKDNLKDLVKKSQANNIKFLGFLEGKELEEQYQNCIATVLPCDWFETFGLTIIESYAYGKPVIASAVGAIPELIKNNINGITVAPGNIDELTAAIQKLNNDKSIPARMGKTNREEALNIYNIDNHYYKLINLYKLLQYERPV